MFTGLAAHIVSSKVLPLESSKKLPLETLDGVDLVSGQVFSSKVKDEDREEQEEGRGEGGAKLGGFFSSFAFCTGR